MIIQQARPEHLDGILALEQDGFSDAEQWSRHAWAEELEADDRLVLAHTDADGSVIGVANFGCVEDMADLNRVVVHRNARGRGVAAQLIQAGIDWAEALGATRMLLEVRTDNDPAVGLYSRLGFDRISLRRDYYGPGLDAVVMLRPITETTGGWDEATDWALTSA
ncbi:MAG: GNAT family N-acetyltransferase [Propionibacteriaceae bacterium]|jgi:ribosomal-protein-alanine N-acetyltransferase|nr:GNAT family N-acetyltransferase [Propionibacteriaceae bacterium]